MSTPVLFLLGALALSLLGGLVVWVASRPRKPRFGSTIDSFSRDLDALAPPGAPRRRRVSHSGGSTHNRSDSAGQPPANGHTRTRPRPGPRINRPDAEND